MIPPRGFSLAETLIALAVASGAVVTVIGLLAGALNTALECRHQSAAAQLAWRLAVDRDSSASPHILLVDLSLQPLPGTREQLEAAYHQGSPLPSAAYFARMDRLPPPQSPGCQANRLRIRIESPASAPAGRRHVRTYVTLAMP